MEGIEGSAEPPGPIDDKGNTGPKGEKTDRGLNRAAQGAKILVHRGHLVVVILQTFPLLY